LSGNTCNFRQSVHTMRIYVLAGWELLRYTRVTSPGCVLIVAKWISGRKEL